VYAGLLAWLYFQQSLTQSSASIVGNAQLVTKVYFPRLVIPLASVASPVVDFGIALTVLLALMAWYGIVPGIELLAAPAFLALALLVAFGIGLWLSALNVRYRDVPYALPFVAQVWLFATPVIYPTSLLPADWRWLLSLNPMTGVIEGFRWSLLGTGKPSVVVVLVSLGSGLALLASGFAYFRASERQFADVI
jgi:lipopolysaccharide transport system permease protein